MASSPSPSGKGLGDGVSGKGLTGSILICFIALTTHAQTILTLPQALQTAATQNLSLQTAALQVEQQRALAGTGFELSRLLVDGQYGQISGPLADRSFNVIQQTALPGLYVAQRRLLESQTLTAEQRARLLRRELAGAVRGQYYQLLVGYRRSALLRRQDSLYRRAARAARVRYQAGATNRLEQVSAEARALEVRERLATLRTDQQVLARQLGQLLGQAGPVLLDTLASPVAAFSPADTLALTPEANPTLGLLRQQTAQSEAQILVEQRRRLPEVRVGYFNQSINREANFQVAQLGLAVPLLGGAGRARVAAARLGQQVAGQQLAYAQAQLGTQRAGLRQQLARARAALDYYQKTALPQARLILDTAEKSFRAGDIEYVEYVVNTEPAWQIQTAYLDQVARYDELVVRLLSL